MTTRNAAAHYLHQHLLSHNGRIVAIYNPHNVPIESLPVIYGFNNGGHSTCLHGGLIAEDGTWLGSHLCSHEGYMPADLGVLEGTRPDRHQEFRSHYPSGYRMEFVRRDEVPLHKGIQAAFTLHSTPTKTGDTP